MQFLPAAFFRRAAVYRAVLYRALPEIISEQRKVKNMTLLEQWRASAYNEQMSQDQYNRFWNQYFVIEKGFYESLLADEEVVTGTLLTFMEKYGIEKMTMVGILDGINDSLKTPNPIETMDEETPLSLDYDKERLYKNMVAAKAEWLYTLPQWDALIDPDRRKELYKEQKSSTTIVTGKKIGRNDPCPCGSGKKYKHCCGRTA